MRIPSVGTNALGVVILLASANLTSAEEGWGGVNGNSRASSPAHGPNRDDWQSFTNYKPGQSLQQPPSAANVEELWLHSVGQEISSGSTEPGGITGAVNRAVQ